MVGTKTPEVTIPSSLPIFATFLNAFVIAGVQGRLAKLERTAIDAVTIPVATTPIVNWVIDAIPAIVAIIPFTPCLDPKFGVVSVLKCQTEIATIKFAVAET